MRATNAVVVVIDRLGAGWLGPYGNTWLDTPQLNGLAARSVVYETVLADTPDLSLAYRAYWSGRHAAQPDGAGPFLPQLADAGGAKTILVTDDPAVADHPLASSFAEHRLVRQRDVHRCAVEVEETGLFYLFSEAAAALREQSQPTLVWIHARGMAGPWDAPLQMRRQFADEEDPEPAPAVKPPEQRLEKGFDPDALLSLVHAYAGQVALADLCLGMLLEAIDESSFAQSTLTAVTSPRGYPLGEHFRVGPCDEALYAELLQTALIIRFPESDGAAARVQRIAQPHELFAAIAEGCGWLSSDVRASNLLREARGEIVTSRDVAWSVVGNQRAIRTPAWFMRQVERDAEKHFELFAKPDDRWEANEVSSLCAEAVELLAAELDRLGTAAQSDQLAELPPLAESLSDSWR